MQPSVWFNYLSSNPIKLEALTTLVLSKVSILTKQSISPFSEILTKLSALKALDISNNNLSNHDLGTIIDALSQEHGLCHLRNLNLSLNNASPGDHYKNSTNPDRFSDKL